VKGEARGDDFESGAGQNKTRHVICPVRSPPHIFRHAPLLFGCSGYEFYVQL
jgi:hypothetical protein